ncbi:MAG: restriction endonuclease subunit S, partial [Deltaproteobacteria bacterium]|nr:restriction endonuclease subunit S [Deltaproteobacteria bacterium]
RINIFTFTFRKDRRRNNNCRYSSFLKKLISSFDKKDKKSKVFEDDYFIEAYCNHLGISFDNYKLLLKNELNEDLLKIDIFSDYQHNFENSSEIRNLKKQNNFKTLPEDTQRVELQRRFIDYIKEIEKEKLYYFILAFQNPQPVLIVKSSNETNKIKEFLGYEWSSAKGNEGIKYLTAGINRITEIDSEYDSESEDVVQNFRDLDNIFTPLYDPQNKLNAEKINTLIVKNFNKEDFEVPESLKEYVNKAKLADMVDFSRTEFNKVISLTPKKNISFKTKWKTVRLGDKIEIKPKSNIQVNQANTNSIYPFFTSGKNILSFQDYLVDGENIYLSTGGNAAINFYAGKAAYSTDTLTFAANTEEIKTRYIFIVLNFVIEEINSNMFEGMGLKHLQKDKFYNIMIPFPLLDVQNKIIDEYDNIDEEIKNSQESIELKKKEIEDLFNDAFNKAKKTYKLSDKRLFNIFIGKRVLKNELTMQGKIPVFSANVFEPFGYINKKLFNDFRDPSVLWGIDGDWMVNYISENIPFYPTDHCGVIRVINSKEVNARYLALILNKEGKAFSRSNRASINQIKSIEIKCPSIQVQRDLASKVENIEKNIKKFQEIIKNSNKIKAEIIKKYL